jgi:DNA-binding transcriptional LysR family regulator
MDRLDLLRLFVTIAETGSLSAAACVRNISTSTVTLGLQRLEDRVSARWINRTTRRLSLTNEGTRFLAQCRQILGDIEDALDDLSENGPLKGEIRVTCTNDFGRNRLVSIIDDFIATHPGVQFSLILSDGVIDLTDNNFDLAIRIEWERSADVSSRLLVMGARSIVATTDYWDRHGRPEHPRDLRNFNCLTLARPDAPQINWTFQENGREFSVRVHGDRAANDGGALRHWALNNGGVILKWNFDIEADLAEGRLEAVLTDYEIAGYNLYTVYGKGSRISRRAKAFVDHLSERLTKPGS